MPLIKCDKSKYNLRNKKKVVQSESDSSSDSESDFETISDEGSDENNEEETEDDDEETEEDVERTPSKKKSVKGKNRRIIEDEEEEEKFDRKQFQKTLYELFPSKHQKDKIEKTTNKKKSKREKEIKSDSDDDTDDDDEEENKVVAVRTNNRKNDKHKVSKEKSSKKSKSKSTRKYKNESETDEDEYDEDYDDEDNRLKSNINIIFEMDDDRNMQEYNDWFGGANGHEEFEENENEECNSEDEENFMKEKYEKIDTPHRKKKAEEKKIKKQKQKDDALKCNVEEEYLELLDLKKNLIQQLQRKPKSTILKNAVKDCNDSIKKLVKRERSKNAKEYHKLITAQAQKFTNEIDYFKKKLSNQQQLKMMKELKEINDVIHIDKPYRVALLDSTIPHKYKANVLQKLNMLRHMEPGDNEYYKIKNWIDTFMRIPFNVTKNFDIKLEDGVDACHNFMSNAMKQLDECVYGLNDAKMQILQMIGQWIANPSAMGTAIGIKGPPGTGKTSLVKEGISKILGREFTFIALGGAGDSSFLEGHSYTYEGSSWGKIVQILIDSKCMNPVIYFDELDKVSDTPRGQEIIGILTHLTDSTQNTGFHDKYFSDIDFDLSKCLFIFSWNDETKVNPILKDRMYSIQTMGYDAKEKLIIARKYLLPKIREQVKFSEDEVIIPDDVISHIISNNEFTKGESGVRNLKRCLEIIYTKLNLFRLMKNEKASFLKDIKMNVTFPYTVTRDDIKQLIKNDTEQNQSLLAMYV